MCGSAFTRVLLAANKNCMYVVDKKSKYFSLSRELKYIYKSFMNDLCSNTASAQKVQKLKFRLFRIFCSSMLEERMGQLWSVFSTTKDLILKYILKKSLRKVHTNFRLVRLKFSIFASGVITLQNNMGSWEIANNPVLTFEVASLR